MYLLDTPLKITSITDKGHEVILLTNIVHRIKKYTLPLFWVDLQLAVNNCNILNLDSLFYTTIKIERPKKKKKPCPSKMQKVPSLLSTSNFCHQSPRCIKCRDNYLFSKYMKAPSVLAKCALLCSGPYTASYKSYPVYKHTTKIESQTPYSKYYNVDNVKNYTYKLPTHRPNIHL